MKSEFDSLLKNIEHLKKASDFIALISEIDIDKYTKLVGGRLITGAIELGELTIRTYLGKFDKLATIEIKCNIHHHELIIYEDQIDLCVNTWEGNNYYFLNLNDIVFLYKLNKNPDLLNFI